MHIVKTDPDYRRDLGNGLILRWSTIDDTEDIVYLTSMVFRHGPGEPPNAAMQALMREAMTGDYPPTGTGDMAVVEDTRRREHRLVCCTFLWRMTWDYEGIPFDIGRPEIVATELDYRNRGLVRAVFELVHARSEAEGHLAQGITGIPYFYRQFGYEYAVDLDAQYMTPFTFIPNLSPGTPEPFILRDATLEDIPFIQDVYDLSRALYPVSSVIPAAWWRYQIEMMHRITVEGFWLIKIIVDQQSASQGCVILPAQRWRQSIPVFALATAPGVNLQALMPSLLRALRSLEATMPAPPDALAADKIRFRLPTTHPAYEVLGQLVIKTQIPYAWYVRVPDLLRFIKHIAPVLEGRLAASPLTGYSGTLSLNFYRSGLQLEFARGKLTGVEPWKPSPWAIEDDDAGFPPLVFLQLLFGRRSLDDLRYAYSDVWAKNEVELLIRTLFPAKPSWVLPLG